MKNVRELVLSYVRSVVAYEGVDPLEAMAEKAGIPPDKIIRLNGNENPYGPSPKTLEALANFKGYNLYPDPEQRKLRKALSEYIGVEPQRIVVGNGSDEIIDLIARMFIGPGDKLIEPSPTFGMYSFCARICGGQVVSVPRDENLDIDVEEIELALDPKVKVIMFASPNNPTGNIAPEWQVSRLLETGRIVVVDETYHEFCSYTVIPLVHHYSNLIVLRTFSKWAGLAGLRAGLGVMDPQLARIMMSMKPPYNVNVAAETAVLASLEDKEVLRERIKLIVAERDRMFSLLNGLPGVKPWPSQANFILCQLPEGRGREIFEGLARKGIFVRYFSHPRLKDFIRISVGLPHETDAVMKTLRELLKSNE